MTRKPTLFTALPKVLLVLFSATILHASCGKDEPRERTSGNALVDIVARDGSDLFSIPFDRYEGDISALPIGVFDSGIGGLTVLEEILVLDWYDNGSGLPGPDGRPDFGNERFVYLGDQANMPYGNYPSEGKTAFLRELILKDAVFLLGGRYWPTPGAEAPQHDKPPVKAIVIACNTATAYGLEDIRRALGTWELPVHLVGVVEAGAEGAVEALDALGGGAAAVMATVGTCASEGYVRAVVSSAERAGVTVPDVIQQGCLGLAGAVEGDRSYIVASAGAADADYRGPSVDNANAMIDPALADVYGFEAQGLLGDPDDPASWRLNSVENYIRYHVATLVHRYAETGPDEPITAVILGCTHFPYYTDRIRAAFARLRDFRTASGDRPYHAIIAEEPAFIDPARLTAMQLYEALGDNGMIPGDVTASAIPTDEFYISVPYTSLADAVLEQGGGFSYDYKYGREPGNFAVEYVKRTPMTAATLSPSARESIKRSMPSVWERLVTFNAGSPRVKDTAGDMLVR